MRWRGRWGGLRRLGSEGGRADSDQVIASGRRRLHSLRVVLVTRSSSSGDVQFVAFFRSNDDVPDAFSRDYLSVTLSVQELHHHPVFVNFNRHVLFEGGFCARTALGEASDSGDDIVRIEEVETLDSTGEYRFGLLVF